MIYEGKLNIKEYTNEEYIMEVLKYLFDMGLSFTPFLSSKTDEVFLYIKSNEIKIMGFYDIIKYKEFKVDTLDCATIIKDLIEYKIECMSRVKKYYDEFKYESKYNY